MKQKEKKERVIHTRISPSLEEELKKKAEGLGVSVSNLVRNILTNTFELVDGIVTDTAQVARSARGDKEQPATPAAAPQPAAAAPVTPTVLGWQRMVLAVNAVCSQCNAIMPRGTEGALAVTDVPVTGQRAMSCLACIEGLGPDTGEPDGDEES